MRTYTHCLEVSGQPLLINAHYCLNIVNSLYACISFSVSHVIHDMTKLCVLLQCIDNGSLKMWANMAAPQIAKNYWHLEVSADVNYYTLYHDDQVGTPQC